MTSCVADILKNLELEMGWDKRYAVPEVDAETMALIEEIRKEEMMLAEANMKIEKNEDTQLMIAETMKGLDHEMRNTEALIKIKEREEEIQKDLAVLADRKRGVLSKRVIRMKTEIQSITERKENLENRILQTNRKLEKFQEKKKWDQQTMEAFLKEAAQQMEDTMAVMKYAHKDDKKVKTLTLAIEKMTMEVNDKRKAFDKALTENKCLQFALDKGTETLRKTYQETQQLTQPWEDTIKQRKQRDAETQQCALQLAQTNAKYRENFATLTETMQRLETQKNNNNEIKSKRDVSKHESTKLGRDLMEKDRNIRTLHDEVGICKAELHKVATSVKSLKSDITKMKMEIQDNNAKLKEQYAHNAALEEKLKVVTRTALTEEERAAQMDQFLKDEEQQVKELDVLLRNNSKDLFRATQQLEALRAKEKDLILQVSNSKSILTNEYKRHEKLEDILRRQRGTVVQQSARIERLNAKLALLQGDMSSDKRQTLEMKMSEVTQNLEEKKKTANILHNALKESKNALCRLKKEVDKSEAQKRDLSSTVDQLMQCCSGKETNLTTLRRKKEECMVRRQILKTEVVRLSNLFYNKENSMLSSEKRKLQLQKVIRDRKDELQLQRDMLRRHLTLSDQDRQRLSMELSEKLHKIDIMKKRFEVMTMCMAVPEEEEERAQAYIITKAALEAEELRRQGNALDAKIQKMELENTALQNGNLLFSHHNAHLRQAINRVDESSPELKDKLCLEEEVKAAEAVLRDKKKQVKELQKDLQDKSDTLETLLQEEQAEKEKMKGKQQPIAKLKKEISSQQEKINRAAAQCSQLIKQIRSAKNTKTETLEEKDIMLKELREFSRTFDTMLSETMEKHPDLKLVLEKQFQQAGLSFAAPPSTLTSRHSSNASSAFKLTSFRSTAPSSSVHKVDLALDVRHLQTSRLSK